ncbi:MAG: VanZ family protein [Peptococcales bacterium]
MPRKTQALLFWFLVFIWMLLIFNLSAQVAEESNKISTGITQAVAKVVAKVAPEADLDLKRLNKIMRKNAHFFAYLLLGFLVINALKKSGVKGYKAYIMAIGICFLYAVSDEVHQLFVPGRGGQIRDVLIDSAGAVSGVILHKITKKALI